MGALKSSEVFVVKKMTIDEVRMWLHGITADIDPEHTLQEVKKAIEGGVSDLTKASEEEKALMSAAIVMLGHERHYLVAESIVDERWRPMVIDLAQSIQKEYGCVSNSEITLAGLAASAYYRSLKAARKLNALLEKTEIGMTGVNLMATVSKEIDRAERQYLSAIETLRNRRQPQMSVKIQAKTAFFNENQTINCAPQPYAETNEPQ